MATLYTPNQSGWEFWPGLYARIDFNCHIWGGDAREIEAANDPHFFDPLERA